MMDVEQCAVDLNTVAAFLAAPDVAALTPSALEAHAGRPRADLLVLLGNAVLDAVDAAAAAFERGLAEELMLVGGVGHSTAHLRAAVRTDPRYDGFALADAPEAVIMKELLTRWYDVDPAGLTLETTSTNCGANAEAAHRLLQARMQPPMSIVLIQDPTMQRRSWASFRKVWGPADATQFINAPPFVPVIRAEAGELVFERPASGGWPMERFVTLVMGEIPRLRNDAHGYGPRGRDFIVAVDIPPAVEAAHDRLLDSFSDRVRWPPT